MKKRIFCMLLLASMVIGCFSGCNIAEKNPENTGTESQSETETETQTAEKEFFGLEKMQFSVDSFHDAMKEGTLGQYYVAKEDIPGTPLTFRVLYTRGISALSADKEGVHCMTEAEVRSAFAYKDVDLDTVDFEREQVIRVVTHFAGTETEHWDCEHNDQPTGLRISDVRLYDALTQPYLWFVFESKYDGGVATDDIHLFVSYLVVSKADLPQKTTSYWICGYGEPNKNGDRDEFSYGTYYYLPFYTILLTQDK